MSFLYLFCKKKTTKISTIFLCYLLTYFIRLCKMKA
nr:MAG TPA: hypothetical protein [Caudoviricetes sp.]DAW58501.1 MAG TPA: hypothetical protein [Caudoviricetes sp.]DAX63173.1 MAG TPA: hypothetical protein [Caudoviricetes sp.]